MQREKSGIGLFRYRILALVFMATTINYFDRSIVRVMAPTLQSLFNWTYRDYAAIMVSFKITYGIGLLFTGGLIDRIGTKLGFTISIAIWSLFGMLHAAVRTTFSLAGFIVAHFGLGIGESGNFPAAIKTDDEAGVPYASEEDTGIWRYHAPPDSSVTGSLIESSTKGNNKFIEYDIEGLALYKKQNGEGYLIPSSRGNNSYAVYTRKHPNKYLGSLRITDGHAYDGSEETGGLDATSFGLGNRFPSGFVVVRDGHNCDNGIAAPQNFKIVNWDSITVRFNPVLK